MKVKIIFKFRCRRCRQVVKRVLQEGEQFKLPREMGYSGLPNHCTKHIWCPEDIEIINLEETNKGETL